MPSQLSPQWAEPPWGAEPRFEFGPALQLASALPTEPRCTTAVFLTFLFTFPCFFEFFTFYCRNRSCVKMLWNTACTVLAELFFSPSLSFFLFTLSEECASKIISGYLVFTINNLNMEGAGIKFLNNFFLRRNARNAMGVESSYLASKA
jgi:hypothetical protein